MDVGVRELKQHLSEYLDRAAAGETIRVTDRGRPKAVLAPLTGRDRLEQGVAEGWLTPATRPGGLGTFHPQPGLRPTSEIFGEDRGE